MNRTVLLSALMALVFAALFAADLQGFFNVASKPVAFVQDYNGTVRRLAKDQLTWDRAAGGTLFGAGDTVSTGESARAKLVFYAGGELDLDSGTMVVLGGSVEELKLNFVTGTGRVRVAENAQQAIKIDDQTKKKTKRVQLAVVKSLPPAVRPVPKADQAQAAKTASVPAPASTEVAKTDAKVDSKADGSHETRSETGKVAAADPADLRANEPSDELIAPAIIEKEIRHPEATLAASARLGEIVQAEELPPVPVVTYPESDAVIDLSKSRSPRLEWSVSTEGKKKAITGYEIVLRPADGKGEEKVLKTGKPALALTQVSKGKYLWSVRAVNADGKRGPASTARWLEVKIPAQIAKPTILPVKVE